MGTLNLTAVTPDTPYIKKIKSALEKATGQSIPLVEVKKVQRKGGVSVVPIFLVFAGGQELTLFARASADVFKSELNGKEIVLPGDFSDDYQQTFDNAVSGIAKLIREAQPKVEQQNQKEKVKLPPRKNRSIQQQISDKREEETQLDQDLSSLTAQRDQLLEQLKQAQAQKEGGEATQGKQIAEGQSSAFDSVDWDEEQHPRDEQGKFSVKSFDSNNRQNDVKAQTFQQPNESFSIYDASTPKQQPDTSTPLKKSVIDFENQIRANSYESGAFFDKTGRIIVGSHGDSGTVSFMLVPAQLEQLKGMVFTHNHPFGGTFSTQDIKVACELQLNEIRAVTRTFRYSMKFKESWISHSQLQKSVEESIEKANTITHDMIKTDAINKMHATDEANHQVWRLIAQQFGFEYTREKS